MITGGHFSQLYVRNLGVFYNALLDSRIPTTELHWLHRQQIAVQTLALDLEIFTLAQKTFTTIVPLRKDIYTGVNIYSEPSDSLFAILYTFNALMDGSFIATLSPLQNKSTQHYPLLTKKVANNLLAEYKKLLAFLIREYQQKIIDENTQLIKTSLLLSSARDGIKRTSSFYDNVIYWATLRLADTLGIIHLQDGYVIKLKQKILNAFWDKEAGIFLDDLSENSQKKKVFSADSFIVTSTGFLQYANESERTMLLQMIQYVKKHALDHPFPLKYSLKNNPKQLYKPVRYFAPSYMGESIWSHWGMEYIKALILLSPYDRSLLFDAKKYLTCYQKNIEMYGGYPELYDTKGKILKNMLYKSVLHNGWVINYEQTRMLLKNTEETCR